MPVKLHGDVHGVVLAKARVAFHLCEAMAHREPPGARSSLESARIVLMICKIHVVGQKTQYRVSRDTSQGRRFPL